MYTGRRSFGVEGRRATEVGLGTMLGSGGRTTRMPGSPRYHVREYAKMEDNIGLLNRRGVFLLPPGPAPGRVSQASGHRALGLRFREQAGLPYDDGAQPPGGGAPHERRHGSGWVEAKAGSAKAGESLRAPQSNLNGRAAYVAKLSSRYPTGSFPRGCAKQHLGTRGRAGVAL